MLFGKKWTRAALQNHVGDISQLIGARRAELMEGNERGAGLIEVWNSSGLRLSLLPGRGLDIAHAEYKGMALNFRSNTGDLGPAFYEPEGFGWLRGFFGGLLATCGLTFVGHPESDAKEEKTEQGLHGRVSFIPAKRVSIDESWEGDDCVVRVRGRVREAIVFGVNLELTREITMRLGEKRFFIRDRVENLGRTMTSPLMVVYHTNPGFPVVAEGTRLVVASRSVYESKEKRPVDSKMWKVVRAPTTAKDDHVYVHDPIADRSGHVHVGLINDRLGDGLGLYWRYRKSELPILNQWQHFEMGTYVTGIEPGNCNVFGRQANRNEGTLQKIGPGETREFNLEMGVLDGRREIAAFEKKAAAGK
jgi:hypothetical protein